uniref:Thioredoxin domain-containing protein n=2 Tax=Setaria italica TaxID=4555 RepID=K3ZY85_SETIT
MEYLGVVTITTTTQLERELSRNPNKLIVLEFMAPWSEPSKVMKIPYRQIAGNSSKDKVSFYTLNVDKFRDLAEEVGVEALPTYVLVKDEDVKDMIVGMKRQELEKAIGDWSK